MEDKCVIVQLKLSAHLVLLKGTEGIGKFWLYNCISFNTKCQ